jgi:8-oxo-dGTP pyrophosphatase MutT (NUDIX family)
MNFTMLNIDQIRSRLTAHRPEPLQIEARRLAAVAMLLREKRHRPEVLFIRRAEYPGDPWSGDLGFPGGCLEPLDSDARAAAERETREEISLCLKPHQYLGQCAELAGAYLPVIISCFAYHLEDEPEFNLNGEVVQTFWVPLQTLLEPQRNRLISFEYRGERRQHPVIELQEWSERPLWGITYRLLQQFFALFDLGFNYRERL